MKHLCKNLLKNAYNICKDHEILLNFYTPKLENVGCFSECLKSLSLMDIPQSSTALLWKKRTDNLCFSFSDENGYTVWSCRVTSNYKTHFLLMVFLKIESEFALKHIPTFTNKSRLMFIPEIFNFITKWKKNTM